MKKSPTRGCPEIKPATKKIKPLEGWVVINERIGTIIFGSVFPIKEKADNARNNMQKFTLDKLELKKAKLSVVEE